MRREPRDAAAYRQGKFALSNGDPWVWLNSFVHNPPLRLVRSQTGAMEGHDRLNGTRPARTASGGEVPWNRRNWLPPINSGWRVRNASASSFCPCDPRRANFRPPVIAAVPERGIAQARSCCSAGPRNPVTKRRSHKRNDPGNDAPSPEDHAWQAAAIHLSHRGRACGPWLRFTCRCQGVASGWAQYFAHRRPALSAEGRRPA